MRVCLGRSAGRFYVGTVAEAGAVLSGIMRCQKTILEFTSGTEHDTGVTISRSSVVASRHRANPAT